jgi:hypothetical protein
MLLLKLAELSKGTNPNAKQERVPLKQPEAMIAG